MQGRFPNMNVPDEPTYKSEKGANNGIASLDSLGKIPVSQLPASVVGALSYQGTWNATTNIPILTSSTGTKGFYYVVNVAGSTNLDGITDWKVGDWAVYNGTVWEKIDNTESVISVFGRQGAVLPQSGDYTTDQVTETATKEFISPSNNVKLGFISVTQSVDLDTMESDITENNAKVGITPTQASDITANNAKVSFPEAPVDGIEYLRKNSLWVSGRLENKTNVQMLAIATPYIGQQVINTTWGQVYTFDGDVWLTANLVKAINENAGAMVEGNVAVQDGAVDNGVDMTTTFSSIAVIGVIKDVYSGGVNGSFVTVAIAGEHNVLCQGSITRGNALRNSSTLGVATDTGSGVTGTFAITRQAQASGTALIKAWIQPTERF